MKKDFLLEVLAQELPYKFIPSAIAQLETAFEKLFKEFNISYDNIEVYATPRRLAVLVNGVVDEETLSQKELRGPQLNIAKTPDGAYSPAALGFAKKNGVETNSLFEREGYIWALVETKSKSAKEILQNNIESIILKLQGSHFMRWGDNKEKFSRPIESVIALMDNEIVDLKIIDVHSSNKTQGHRYTQNRYITINSPKEYIEKLREANVIVKQDERRDFIVKSATKCANDNNLNISFDKMEDLLEEITYITEYPVPVLCEFDKKYLVIPSIVTTTVMTSHQRYFPLWQKDGKLSNYFITMANYVGDDFSNIKAGNQRVVSARLEDGIFFYHEDTKSKLIEKTDNLKGMTFQKGLGSLYDKTQRLIKLSDKIADSLGIKEKEDIKRCATLSKCDLSTKLVFEFTELQGFIGENYALLDGEKEDVAKGICEHYFPLGANSELPSCIEGKVVSLADKIDTISALFISTQGDMKKKRPTGSNDPLGARRAAIGVLRIILENKYNLDLSDIIKYSLKTLSEEFSIPLEDTIYDDLNDFYKQRLLFMYEGEYSPNLINSIYRFNPLSDLAGFVERLNIIKSNLNNSDFIKLKENATRVVNILAKSSAGEIREDLFVEDEEKALYSAILSHNTGHDDLDSYIKSLVLLNDKVEAFFEKVLVMDRDEKIKNNRISLLGALRDKYSVICDFEKL